MRPMVCTPLESATYEQLMEQMQQVLEKSLISLNDGRFLSVTNTEAVIKAADAVKKQWAVPSGKVACLSRLLIKEVLELDAEISRKTSIEFVNCALSTPAGLIKCLLKVSAAEKTKNAGSFHNFDFTSCHEECFKKLADVESAKSADNQSNGHTKVIRFKQVAVERK